jgi:cyclic pyranopterin monophosphate synthase
VQIRRFCLSHVNKVTNTPTMVNVGNKEMTLRIAHARCYVEFPENVMNSLTKQNNEMVSKKGPVFTTAIIGGVMAAKKTSDLIPFCHPIALDDCEIKIDFDETKVNTIRIDCTVRTWNKTGVEMEAFVGASNAALCVYDMCKAASHDIKITDLQLISKTGGKRDFFRNSSGQSVNKSERD